MKKLIVIVVLLVMLAVGVAWAWLDNSCVNDCMRRGYSYSYCLRPCSY